MGRVKMTMKIELPADLGGMLHESERVVLIKAGEKAVEVAQDQWKGWKYGTQYTPARPYPESQRGTSHAAWRYETQFTESPFGIRVFNDAKIKPRQGSKKNGKPYSSKSVGNYYAAFVHRAGGDPKNTESIAVWDRIVDEVLEETSKNLLDEIQSNIGRDRVTVSLRPDQANVGTEFFSFE